jgi:NAD(P)-dependent dehydrogenase (short-subunit alcohol dehydrogenase family)
MNAIASGTVLITGPTGGLGKAATLAIANRPAEQRPDLVLVGRPGQGLTEVAEAARAAGATAQEIGCDLARLADVRAAGRRVKDLLEAGALRPLRGIVANAGVSVADTHNASADGYELTFAVNHLAHAQLIGGWIRLSRRPVSCCWGQTRTTRTYFAVSCGWLRRSGGIRSNSRSLPNPMCRPRWKAPESPIPTQNSRSSTTRTNCSDARPPVSISRYSNRDSCRARV